MSKAFLLLNPPTESQFAAFITDAADERFEAIARRGIFDDLFAEYSQLPDEELAALLARSWEAVDQYFQDRFQEDAVLGWLKSQDSILRAWTKALGKRAMRAYSGRERANHAVLAAEIIVRRRQQWAARPVQRDRKPRSPFNDPFSRTWLLNKAWSPSGWWKWTRGLAKVVNDYLHTERARELIEERKAINGLFCEMIKGLDALERFLNTHLGMAMQNEHQVVLGAQVRALRDRSMFDSLADVELTNFYPASRQDATAKERLMVASLCDLHCSLFRVPKPEAIAEIMSTPFVANPLDLRNIERLCQDRRQKFVAFKRCVSEARSKAFYLRHGRNG